MRLVDALRRDSIPGPLRRAFRKNDWERTAAPLIEDDSDRSLARAAALIYEKAETIRASLRFADQSAVNSTTRLRALVAFANYNMHALDREAEKVIKRAAPESTLLIAEVVSARVRLPDGFDYSPDEVSQTIVDGVQIPLRFIFGDGIDCSAKPRFHEVNWDDVQFDANLGVLYSLIEGLWDDCLWNDLRVSSQQDGSVSFAFADLMWPERAAISRCRIDNLRLQFMAVAGQSFRSLPRQTRARVLAIRPVVRIAREGRHRKLVLARMEDEASSSLGLALLRLLGRQPYYGDILAERQPSLSDATLDQLISAWAIVSSATEVMSDAIRGARVAEDAPPGRWLPMYAPILDVPSLVDAVVGGAGVPKAKAEALVHFLTYRGEPNQELWTQPLVRVADGRLAPIFGAALFPNLGRLIDRWMQQLGVDMGQRGPAFEQHVRDHLIAAIRASRLHQHAAVLPNALKLRLPSEAEEEIDIVFVLGNVVLICEAKCVLLPTEPKQEAFHRQTIMGAVDQINRKATVVERHRALVSGLLRSHGIIVSDDFSIIRLVILNSEMHSGFQVEGVTIVDENILRMFFEGEIVDLALGRQDGRMDELAKRTFYRSPEEAYVAAPRYFASPPQMDAFKAHVTERITPVPAIADSDWSGYVRSSQCLINTPPFEPVSVVVDG